MRAYVLRHRLRAGDRLVLRDLTGTETGVSAPIEHVGTDTVVVQGGSILPLPEGAGTEIERATPSFLGDL